MSIVYFLKMEAALQLPEALEKVGLENIIKPRDFCAVKMHFGEKGNKGYIHPKFIKPITEKIAGLSAYPFLTDTNTIYIGQRADAWHHLKVAAEHGYSLEKIGVPVIIADGLRGNSSVNVEIGQKHFFKVKIANAIHYADSLLFISHFKGHELYGFGGALKNIGMGCAARAGKYSMHDALRPKVEEQRCKACGVCLRWCSSQALTLVEDKKSDRKMINLDKTKCRGCGECILSCPEGVFQIPWDETAVNAQEKMIEYAYGTLKNKRYFCINFLNFITRFCDCFQTKEAPLIDDIGILFSLDPVSIDQAGMDLVNQKAGRNLFPEIGWKKQLEYAEKLGIGQRNYQLLEV
ncbi:MAG: DUF362 domain-containing protein [Elusimicrobiota bacterium]